MTAQIIDGKAIGAQVRAEIAERARKLKDERGITPGLALVLVGDNPSSLSYVRSKGDTAEQAGLYSDLFHFPESTDETRIISHIQDLNADPRFHGILVQLPLPKHMREDVVISAIEPAKDADGVTVDQPRPPAARRARPWPATPAGIVELLHRSGQPARRQARRRLRALEHRRQAGRGDPHAEEREGQRHRHPLPHRHAATSASTPARRTS